MLPFSIIKLIHLVCGTTILGVCLGEFFYIHRSIESNDRALIRYLIKASYFGDGLIFICIALQLLTISPLIFAGGFTSNITWIFVAHLAFGTVILLWLIKIFIKIFLLSRNLLSQTSKNIYDGFSVLILFIFFIIIHDAVTRSTWFEFLFRN